MISRVHRVLLLLMMGVSISACGPGDGVECKPAPSITPEPPLTATVGSRYIYDYDARYNCGLTVCNNAEPVILPDGASMNDFADVITWVPGPEYENTSVQFKIRTEEDFCGKRAGKSWRVKVQPAPPPPPDNTPPLVPDQFSAVSDLTPTISLMWEESTDNTGVEGYKIYRDGIYLQDVLGVSFTDTSLTSNTIYCYQVTAVDAAGNESSKSVKACASSTRPSKIMDLGYWPGSVGGVGMTSLALDATYNVHISYYDNINKNLYYATNEATAWSISAIDSNVYGSPSIAVDASNKVHISYTGDGVYSLKYATNISGSWVISTVDDYWAGLFSSLAIDSFGNAHISYYDYQNGNLKYATNLSGLWETSTIDTGYVGKSTSIALDSKGKVHISYYDVQNGDLKFATNANDIWEISTLDSTGDVGQSPSLAIDSEDKVHISYYDATNRQLKYATNATGTWVTSIIHGGVSAGTGWNSSLTLDNAGHIHISYNDWGYQNLRYATNASGAWKLYLIAPGGSGLSSIKLDSSGWAHLSSHQSTNIIYSIYSIY